LSLARALALAALVGGSTPAAAAEGLFLTWNGCATAPGAQSNLAAACDTDLGEQTLDCAFTLGSALDSVVALEVVIDVQVSGPALPDWWQLAPGGCRENALIGRTVFPAGSPCVDFWRGWASPAKQAYYYGGLPRGGASQARIVLTCALVPDSAVRLEAATMYHAVRLVLRNQSTTLCDGCAPPACFVLNSILVGRRPDAQGGNLLLQAPGPDLANRATWQGGAGECAAVPTRPESWSRIKSLYR
jgi:hypothetical protein